MKDLSTIASASPRFALLVITIIVSALVWLVVRAFKEGREISFWPPRLGPRQHAAQIERTPNTPNAAALPVSSAVDQKVEIQSIAVRERGGTEWYSRWEFGDQTYIETLTFSQSQDGRVTGYRWIESSGGPTKYAVSGYARDGFFWLEYHDDEDLGGGVILLNKFTNGRLRGVVTSANCKTGRLRCAANEWLPKRRKDEYDKNWQSVVGHADTRAAE